MNTALPGQPTATPTDRLTGLPKPATPVAVRERLLDLLRRDLVGPHPDLDPDLAREVLSRVAPSTWYLTGFLGPRRKSTARRSTAAAGTDAAKEEAAEDMLEAQRSSEGLSEVVPGRGDAPDEGNPESPPVRSFQPSSLGLTVLLPRDARQLQARVTWGDYVTEPPLEDALIFEEAREATEARGEVPKPPARNTLDWRRIPREEPLTLVLRPGPGRGPKLVFLRALQTSLSGAAALSSGGPNDPADPYLTALCYFNALRELGGARRIVDDEVRTHLTSYGRNRVRREPTGIDGVKRELLAVSVFMVNARPEALRRFGDVVFCFQARLQLDFPAGFERRDDRASYDAVDFDERLADLHYRDVYSYAVGHNTSGDWAAPVAEGRVTSVFTNPLPVQEVEKLGADVDNSGVALGMAVLAQAAQDAATLDAALSTLPRAYEEWAKAQAGLVSWIDGVRRPR